MVLDAGTVLGIIGLLGGIIAALIKLYVQIAELKFEVKRFAKVEEKIDTLWLFQERRGIEEAEEAGILKRRR